MGRITKKESLKGLEGVISSKKIGNNTFEIEYSNGDIAIRLHYTNIITVKPNGNIILNSGGWKTNTTKDRINKYLNTYLKGKNWNISQVNYNWQLQKWGYKNGKYSLLAVKSFFDNMELTPEGETLNRTENNNLSNQDISKYKKAINKYVNLIDKMDTLPIPSNGDCWHCLLKSQNDKNLGDELKSIDHLINHFEINIFLALY